MAIQNILKIKKKKKKMNEMMGSNVGNETKCIHILFQ